MATISIYQAEDNRYYQVSVDIATSVLDRTYGSVNTNPDIDYYLRISTTLKKSDNTAFSKYVVRTLADVPPGYGTALNFTDLVDDYVNYFITEAQLGWSSSSSSLSSSSSSSYVENWSSSSSSLSSSSSSTEVRSSSSSSSPQSD